MTETRFHWADYVVTLAMLLVSLGIGFFFALFKGGQKTKMWARKVSNTCRDNSIIVEGRTPAGTPGGRLCLVDVALSSSYY
ncbi:hypothetical protein ACOMHN_028720 [Nucella lapillus]